MTSPSCHACGGPATRTSSLALVLSLGLVAWSLVANLVLGDTLYVVRNLVLTSGLVLLVTRRGSSGDELGLARRPLPRGLLWGGAAVITVALVVRAGVVFADDVEALGALLDDRRAQLPMTEVGYHALVRIPFGTALFEEIAFRGALLAVFLRRSGTVAAVGWSSVVFGLWHVGPTIVALELNGVTPASMDGLLAIAGAVAVTAVAGILFSVLRLVSRSLAAPFLAHWATNAFGLLAAATS